MVWQAIVPLVLAAYGAMKEGQTKAPGITPGEGPGFGALTDDLSSATPQPKQTAPGAPAQVSPSTPAPTLQSLSLASNVLGPAMQQMGMTPGMLSPIAGGGLGSAPRQGEAAKNALTSIPGALQSLIYDKIPGAAESFLSRDRTFTPPNAGVQPVGERGMLEGMKARMKSEVDTHAFNDRRDAPSKINVRRYELNNVNSTDSPDIITQDVVDPPAIEEEAPKAKLKKAAEALIGPRIEDAGPNEGAPDVNSAVAAALKKMNEGGAKTLAGDSGFNITPETIKKITEGGGSSSTAGDWKDSAAMGAQIGAAIGQMILANQTRAPGLPGSRSGPRLGQFKTLAESFMRGRR